MSDNEKIEQNEEYHKKIEITGISNRYLIKKITGEKKKNIKRKKVDEWTFNEDYYKIDEQLNILKINDDDKIDSDKQYICNIINKEIDKKLSGYKQQDKLRKIYDANNVITRQKIKDYLLDCNLDCYYCREKCLILYELQRENKQWTLDRINNDVGHNHDNVVISCLECNIKRRRKSKDAFVFTKQLKIVKKYFI